MAKKTNDKMVSDKVTDGRTQKERRADRLKLRDKAKAEAIEQDLPFDESLPAMLFETDYAGAFKQATESEKAIPAAELKAIAAKVAAVTSQPTEKTSAQLTAEAARAAMLGTGANDNTEQTKDESTTEAPVEEQVVVPTEETPKEDATEVPVEDVAVIDPMLKRADESRKQWRQRLHNMKRIAAAEETRNGEPLVEETPVEETKHYPTGDLVHHSDEDGQSLTPTPKSAEESATVFAAVEETPIEPAKTEETPVEEAPEAKPTLTIASSNTEKPEVIEAARKFYGSTWTEERGTKLTKAYKFLMLAIKLQQSKESENRVNLPLTTAIRLESEALSTNVAQARAA